MAQNAVFKRLSEIAEVASLNSEERRKYDESLRAYRDTIAVMEGQFAQGELKGRAEGRAEGILSIARKMKQKGKPVSEIAEMTDLSPDEIEKL
jgi:predicted transposase/invertase (TIGR01784 family)